MTIPLLLSIPLIGILFISTRMYYHDSTFHQGNLNSLTLFDVILPYWAAVHLKSAALKTSIFALLVSLVIFALFDFSTNQFQFVQEYHEIGSYNFYLGIDGLSIYFVLLTTIIMPISLLSNWKPITHSLMMFLIIILLLETLLLSVFLVLDILLSYIFFESILPPLFLLIGLFGSSNRVRASFYLFLCTLWSLLLLLNRPPKSHAFVSLPTKSFINIRDIFLRFKLSIIILSVGLVWTIFYRLPLRFILDELGLPYLYPFFASVILVLYVMVRDNIMSKDTSKQKLINAALLGFFIPLLLPYLIDIIRCWLS